ncbi:tRNA-specific adenosine deaminase 1 [Actinomortierella ambigua]|nr:tRNA-specific adenosine deaminase 1 [Actinomortierella ambigua]
MIVMPKCWRDEALICGDATTESLAEIQTEESRTAFYAGRGEETTNADSPATGVTTVETSQSSTTTTGSKHDLIDKRPSSVPTKVPRTDLDNSVTTASTAASLRSDVSSKAKSQDEIDTLLASKDDPSSQCSLPFRRGRIDYACITALRTKPGRVDSEPTLSMSCSDKIARWNVLGLNSALVASLLDQPLYLDSIVSHELFDAQALRRALYARFDQISILSALTGPSKVKAQEDKADEEEHSNAKIDQEPHDQDNQSLGYHLHRPKIWYTTHEFEFTKDAVTRQAEQEHQQLSSSSSPSSSTSLVLPVASPNSISWTAGLPVEVIVNGCKAGASAKHTPSRQLPLKSQSRLCKSQMFKTGLQLWEQVTEHRTQSEPESVAVAATTLQEGAKSYGAWKRQIAPTYQQAKAQLFQGALKHWVKGLPELEQFDVRGNIVANTIQ